LLDRPYEQGLHQPYQDTDVRDCCNVGHYGSDIPLMIFSPLRQVSKSEVMASILFSSDTNVERKEQHCAFFFLFLLALQLPKALQNVLKSTEE